jgi:hypothetical protein
LAIGQTISGEWVRMYVSPRWHPLARSLLKTYIRQKKIDRLALVVPGDFVDGRPRLVQVACMERATNQDETIEARVRAMDANQVQLGTWTLVRGGGGHDLERLAGAARQELFGSGGLMRVLGRPWPIALIVIVLALELIENALRLRWVVAGYVSWLPSVPYIADVVLNSLYMLLIAATAVELWRQSRWAFRLALLLAALQFARTVLLVAATAQQATPGQLAFGLLGGLLFPAVIVINLTIVARSKKPSPGL